MKPTILLTALLLTACSPGPKSGQVIPPIPAAQFTSSTHPVFLPDNCGGPGEKLPSGEWRCF